MSYVELTFGAPLAVTIKCWNHGWTIAPNIGTIFHYVRLAANAALEVGSTYEKILTLYSFSLTYTSNGYYFLKYIFFYFHKTVKYWEPVALHW